MALELGDAIVRTIAAESAKRLYPSLVNLLPSGSGPSSKSIEKALSRHLKHAASWASQYNFLGLSAPKDAKLETIPLRLTNIPRRYRGQASGDNPHELKESAFLASRDPVILLGDPGAGKTTTLKRICLQLLGEPDPEQIDFQIPLVVILRDLGSNTSLLPFLANALEVDIEQSHENRESHSGFLVYGFDAAEKLGELLDNLSAVVIIDGLDELPIDQRSIIEKELQSLVTFSKLAKIIVSCRSGDYNRPLQGYAVYELLPLSRDEIVDISSSWLPDPEIFLQHLDAKPYRDVIDRPLLLSFLLFLFINEGSLPAKPSQIYRKVVYRLLKDWDDERGIKRGSAYANFDIDVKIDFLSEFSYLLTYKLKSRGFTEFEVLDILETISETYAIPRSQFTDILREIETHTGIVVAAGFDRFEFAHLSVQEFLCASFICRSPIPDLLKKYLSEYPAPVAVACALSSQPDLFLHQMFCRHLVDKFRNQEDVFYAIAQGDQLAFDLFGSDTSNTLYSFLTRLDLERPALKASRELGEFITLLYAFYYRRYTKEIDDALERLVGWPACRTAFIRFAQTENWLAYSLTRNTASLIISPIFKRLYEETAGPWPADDRKAKILPVAMIPKLLLREAKVHVADEEGEEAERNLSAIKNNISGTPFCIIELGRHRRRSSNGVCEVCGNQPAYRNSKKLGNSAHSNRW